MSNIHYFPYENEIKKPHGYEHGVANGIIGEYIKYADYRELERKLKIAEKENKVLKERIYILLTTFKATIMSAEKNLFPKRGERYDKQQGQESEDDEDSRYRG